MASRAAIQPDCCHLDFAHCPSLIKLRLIRKSGCFGFGTPTLLLSNKAPVGHTWTHFPQRVQEVDEPHGSFRSVITIESMPRPITSHTCAPSTSAQTRTQREH